MNSQNSAPSANGGMQALSQQQPRPIKKQEAIANSAKSGESFNRAIMAGSQKGKQVNTAMSPPKKTLNASITSIGGGERGGVVAGATGKSDISLSAADGPKVGNAANNENNLFNKHYNKELKLCEDEIPMVLCELNESALAYLGRDQFENALLLLQKAHGVLDVVDLTSSSRDQQIALQLFHNMAMCYQKQGQLEECALCLETTLDHMGKDYASLKNQSFAMRIYKLKMEAKLRLQFCAILSQLHRHKEALEQAQEGIKIAHLVVRDKIAVCRYYARRIDLKANEPPPSTQSIEQSDKTDTKSRARSKSKGKKRQPSAALDGNSKSSFPFDEEDDHDISKHYRLSESATKDLDAMSDAPSVGQYQTKQSFYNNMEGTISLIEKTSTKLLPIYKEILTKIKVIEKSTQDNKADSSSAAQFYEDKNNGNSSQHDIESSDVDSKIGMGMAAISNFYKANGKKPNPNKKAMKEKQNQQQVDLRHILGFLNQTEWIQNLNIGNIMQISPIKLEDLCMIRRNEECLARESFLEIISFLIVGYFCASTEIRFIIQLKDEISKFIGFSVEKKTQESELWHTMSLDIACSFLPSDCPLLNHILLSYQKHHAPSQTQIPENSTLDEKTKVIRPLTGIDNSRYQPIIRELADISIQLPRSTIEPAQKAVRSMVIELNRGSAQGNAIEDLNNQHMKYLQGGNAFAQQSQNVTGNQLKRHQLIKLVKLEKIIGKFSKEIGFDHKDILRILLGENNQPDMKNNLMNSNSGQQSQVLDMDHGERPKSQQDSISQRQNLDSINTGQAAKIAYNNMGKYPKPVDVNQTMISNKSQSSFKSQNSQGGGAQWRMSPQSFMESRNGKQFSNGSDQNAKNGDIPSTSLESKKTESVQNAQRQRQFTGGNGEMRVNDTESSHRTGNGDNSALLNDLSQVQMNHHDKSFNEQLDERSKFVLNQGDAVNSSIGGSQHHNFSIGTMGGNVVQSQGGTVRQSSKRINSQERGSKMQRPRSSKGYRGGQFASNQNQALNTGNTSIASGSHSHVGAIDTSHNMSVNQPPSSNILNSNSNIHSSAGNPSVKLQMSKSEERSLKSQQNTRTILNKNQRQKTAGGHGLGHHQVAAHTASHGFPKDSHQSKSTNLVSLGNHAAGQFQSQSSSQLPSAQSTNNFQKMSKKQLQQIQQQHALLAAASVNSTTTSNSAGAQMPAAQLNNYNTYNGMKNQKISTTDYDKLRKQLIKEYGPQQAQQIIAQHMSSQGLLQTSNTQSQNNFPSQLEALQSQGARSSSNIGKSKKLITQSQNQLVGVSSQHNNSLQNQSNLQGNQSLQSFDKFDQIGVSLDGPNSISQNVHLQGNGQNKDLKELIHNGDSRGDLHGNVNSQQKKAKQILAQARKQSANKNDGTPTQSMNSSIPHNGQPGQNVTSHQQAQQIYLNSLHSSMNMVRPSSSHKSHQNSIQQNQMHSGGRGPNQVDRQTHSKSALGTVGLSNQTRGNHHQSSQPLLQNQGQVVNQQQMANSQSNNSNSLKRREKGRLIMQEWLTKSNAPNAGQSSSVQVLTDVQQVQRGERMRGDGGNQQLSNSQQQQHMMAQQVQAISQQQQMSNSQQNSANQNKKFIQQQMGMNQNLQQIQLTKQQQQQLQQISLAKQNHQINQQISANRGEGQSRSSKYDEEPRRKSQQ